MQINHLITHWIINMVGNGSYQNETTISGRSVGAGRDAFLGALHFCNLMTKRGNSPLFRFF